MDVSNSALERCALHLVVSSSIKCSRPMSQPHVLTIPAHGRFLMPNPEHGAEEVSQQAEGQESLVSFDGDKP